MSISKVDQFIAIVDQIGLDGDYLVIDQETHDLSLTTSKKQASSLKEINRFVKSLLPIEGISKRSWQKLRRAYSNIVGGRLPTILDKIPGGKKVGFEGEVEEVCYTIYDPVNKRQKPKQFLLQTTHKGSKEYLTRIGLLKGPSLYDKETLGILKVVNGISRSFFQWNDVLGKQIVSIIDWAMNITVQEKPEGDPLFCCWNLVMEAIDDENTFPEEYEAVIEEIFCDPEIEPAMQHLFKSQALEASGDLDKSSQAL